ncbi:MAG: OadG family protein [Actinomycetota bacterium]
MISDGLVLTLAGMLVAFAFLGLMALSTTAMSGAIQRWFPTEEPAPPPPRTAPDDTAVAIAIAAAHLHK